MRWMKRNENEWRKKFAWLPISIGDATIWLETYERRFCGEYWQVREVAHGFGAFVRGFDDAVERKRAPHD